MPNSQPAKLALIAALSGLFGGVISGPLYVLASRSAGGTYSNVSGIPVSTGTTISATVFNNAMADYATEMTDSLNRSGKGAMLAPLRLTNGSVSAPAVTFDSDTDVGLYRIGANNPAMSAGNTLCQSWATTGSTFPLGVTVTQSQTNTAAITATGNGTAAGVSGTGGSTAGAGVSGAGGAAGGPGGSFTSTSGSALYGTASGGGGGAGVVGTGDSAGSGGEFAGGTSSGYGVSAGGGAPNGVGVRGTGAGTGAGGEFVNSATGYGLTAQADTTTPVRAALKLVPQDTAPSSPQEGAIYVNSTTNRMQVYLGGGWRDLNTAP